MLCEFFCFFCFFFCETKKSAFTKSTASPVEFGTMTEFRVPLTVKILTHDQLIGRLIGRGGSNLAEIKKSTETRITIPNSAPGSGCNGSGFHCESNEGYVALKSIMYLRFNFWRKSAHPCYDLN